MEFKKEVIIGRVIQGIKDFSNRVKQALATKLNKLWPKKLNAAEAKVRTFTYNFFADTETFRSLSSGGLSGSFGFVKGTAPGYADWFITTVANNIEIKFTQLKLTGGAKFSGGVRLTLPLKVYQELLNSSESIIDIEDGALPWVDWLLFRGDEVIVDEFHVVFKENAGRSGIAIMGKGGFWKVPAKYSGFDGDNWITRTMTELKDYLNGVSKILTRELL